MYNQIKKLMHNRHDANTSKRIICFTFVILCAYGSFSKLYAQKTFRQRGIASYYTDRFDGRETASGETFDNKELVGSHKKLPFNTMVKVTNLANKRSIVVRINDRGPYAHGRIIDISKTAAQKIGLYSTGTAKVLIEAVGSNGVVKLATTTVVPVKRTNNNRKTNTKAYTEKDYKSGNTYGYDGLKATPRGYGVQVGYFTNLKSTKERCAKVKNKTNINDLFIQVGWDNKKQRKIYRVLVGSFATKDASSLTQRQIKNAGFKYFMTRHFK